MTPVVLSAAQARERHRHATGGVAFCVCRSQTAGWEVRT